MNTMKWLLRREFWEHKGALYWAPMVIATILLVFIGGGIAYSIASGHANGIVIGHGHVVSGSRLFMPDEVRSQVAAVASTHYLGVAAPLFLVLPVVVFFYCLGALHDDRRDRSILFWKSLPVSDQMTVLSKVVTALCLAPAITIVLGVATALGALLLVSAGAAISGVNLVGAILANPNLYLAPLYLIGLLPVYFLWALPTVGWLLMVSSWARSKVFLWAVGTPLITVVILKWFNFIVGQYSDSVIDIHWFVRNVVARGLGGLIPGLWLPFSEIHPSDLGSKMHGLDLNSVFTHSWMSLGQPGVWVAAAVGVAMLFAAARMRRWRDEG
jgi:ABC-2 type transport system permease protein